MVSFEYAQIQFKINFFEIDIVVIYRPPYSEQHPISVNVFMEEFGDFVSDVFLNCNRCCFVGDFNLHVNNPFDVDSQSFNDLLNSFCLNQIVTVPTHTSGNTLDLVLVRENSDFEIFNKQSEFHLSDHSFVLFNLSTKRPRLVRKETKFRKLKAIDDSLFQHDLKHLFSELQEICELEEIVSAYDKGLTDILDKYAPIISKKVTVWHTVPWFNKDAQKLKTQTRTAERHWFRCKSAENWNEYCRIRNIYKKHLNISKYIFISQKISACGNDKKMLFGAISDLTGHTQTNPLPDGVSDERLADDFATFFHTKVEKISSDLDGHPLHVPEKTDVPTFCNFTQIDVETTEKLINNAKPTTCDLDPIPSHLVKQHSKLFAPVICKIVNISLSSGRFASSWKKAIVKPLLKKPTLDHIKKNYRPVSNLSFLSKLVEKASMLSFSGHVENNNLLPEYQSAYREATETLLLKVYNDILHNFEHQKLSPFIAVDLSAAFDTVHHGLLLDVMENCFGVRGIAKDWMSSYLSARSMEVCVNGKMSKPVCIDLSVPQGSINGPIYFTCYSSTLGRCIQNSQELIGSADDHALYDKFANGNLDQERHVLDALSSTLDSVKNWMLSNHLKMNDDKT